MLAELCSSPDGNTVALMARGISNVQRWRDGDGHSHIDETALWTMSPTGEPGYRRQLRLYRPAAGKLPARDTLLFTGAIDTDEQGAHPPDPLAITGLSVVGSTLSFAIAGTSRRVTKRSRSSITIQRRSPAMLVADTEAVSIA